MDDIDTVSDAADHQVQDIRGYDVAAGSGPDGKKDHRSQCKDGI